MKNIAILPTRTNVLCIGDSFNVLKGISFELQRAWCSVLWETRGLDGLRTAIIEEPDLIICEMNLQDIGGLDLCRRLRADESSHGIPIILVDNADGSITDLDALEAGADEFFRLPEESERLLSRVFWLAEGGLSKPGSANYYKCLLSQQLYISRVITETSELLHEIEAKRSYFGIGSGRSTSEPNFGVDTDLGMQLLGLAADLFEPEAVPVYEREVLEFSAFS